MWVESFGWLRKYLLGVTVLLFVMNHDSIVIGILNSVLLSVFR